MLILILRVILFLNKTAHIPVCMKLYNQKELFYFLVDTIAQNKFNMDFLATDLNCNKELLEYDLVIVNKRIFIKLKITSTKNN